MMNELKNLTALYGPSGHEEQVAEYILARLAEMNVDGEKDSLGNVLVQLGQGGRRILVTAHMDAEGFMLTKIDEKGFGSVSALGKVDAAAAVGGAVVFENGTEAIICPKGDAVKSAADLFLDFGVENKETLEKKVCIGDMAVFAPNFRLLGDRAVSSAMNDRAGCAVLLDAIGRIKAAKNTMLFLFSTQDVAGTSGAGVGVGKLNGEIAIAVDTSPAVDAPGAKETGTLRLGCGAGIRISDAGTQCSPQVIGLLQETAKSSGIKVQQDILTEGRLEGENLAKVGTGMRVGGVTIPCRYLHTTGEMIDKNDMEACATLIAALAEKEL